MKRVSTFFVFKVDINNKKIIPAELKNKEMYQHRTDHTRQILISRCKFPQEDISNISFALENLSSENCPIPLIEFEEYELIPGGISKKGIAGIKEYFFSKGAYICFTGIPKEAIHG